MIIEREVIISVLELAKERNVSHKLINVRAKVPSSVCEKLLRKLQNDGLIYVSNGFVEADGVQRLKLAVRAMELGADIERVSSLLGWQEFEDMAAIALRQSGHGVQKNLRFKHAGRRWEIDVISCKRPIVMSFDCKQWRHGISSSALEKIVEEQKERTKALADSLPNLAVKTEFASWEMVILIPVVLSLTAGRCKLCNGVPVVSVFQLQDFVSQVPAYVNSFEHFQRTFRTGRF